MNKKLQISKYLISDFFAAVISWISFYIFRKIYIEPLTFGIEIPLTFGTSFILGLILIPLSWLLLYYLLGYYKDVFRKSRLGDFSQTFVQVLIGVLIIFFFLILDDYVDSYRDYYLLFAVLFSLQFLLTLIPRLIFTSIQVKKIHRREFGFNTLMIGSNQQAVEVYKELQAQTHSYGNKILGFVSVHNKDHYQLSDYLLHFGDFHNLEKILKEQQIEEVIIALETSEHKEISKIINILGYHNVVIKVIPNMYDILTGKVKMTQLFGTPLIQLSHDLMPTWQENLKYLFDYTFSILFLAIFSPLIIILAIGVKLSSSGPIFYSHERIGRYGKPFQIYKFRSMCTDAEKHGPKLSSKNDNRLTNIGRFMRKYRLDEIPNFFNVLKGEMSMVGPRPERQFYIDQIVKKAPHYIHLHKVKPGITSWGQVKYGYAENVDQMIKRLRFDIIYIENMSLFVDFKIIFYTISTVLRGSGM